MSVSFKKMPHYFYLLLIYITLAGCGQSPHSFNTHFNNDHTYTPLTQTAKQYLELAQQASPIERDNLKSFAAIKLSREADLKHAKKLVQSRLHKPSPKTNLAIRHLAKATLAHANQNHNSTLRELNLAKPSLPPRFDFNWYNLLADSLSHLQQPDQAILALANAYEVLPEDYHFSFLAQHWQQLVNSAQSIPNTPPNAMAYDFSGWQDLAQISQQGINQAEIWPTLKKDWLMRHPNHEATSLLNTNKTPNWPMPNKIKTIGVILPLHGIFAKQATTILYGITDGVYQYNAKHPNNTLGFEVFDSSPQKNTELIHFAKKTNLDVIIGPLRKQNIALLNQDSSIIKPILALNPPPLNQKRHNVFWLDLTQQSEVQMLSQKMIELGYQNPLVITQPTPLGHKLSTTFQEQWQNIQATPPQNVLLPVNPKENSQNIKETLGIKKSQKHTGIIKKYLGKSIISSPNRRHDIDAIFLAMNGQKAREILPLIRYYYGGDLPTFSTSIIQRGNPTQYQNQDFEKIRYLDHLPQSNTTRTPQVRQLKWPSYLNRHPFFYRIGLDAFALIINLPILSDLPLAQYHGKTGLLSVNSDQTIRRKLEWLTIKKGLAQPSSKS